MQKNPIIIIDDDDDDCQLIKNAFIELRIKNEMIIFDNPVKAFDYLSTMHTQPFFIICDVNMPRINGLELRKKINDIEKLRLKAVPFLLWSTSGREGLINQAFSLNIQGFFKKPDNAEQLKQMMQTIMNYWECSDHPIA